MENTGKFEEGDLKIDIQNSDELEIFLENGHQLAS